MKYLTSYGEEVELSPQQEQLLRQRRGMQQPAAYQYGDTMAGWNPRWQEPTPALDKTASWFERTIVDPFRSAGAGVNDLIAGSGWLLEQMGAEDWGGAIQEFGRNGVDYWEQGLTEETRAALQRDLFDVDEEGNSDFNWTKLTNALSRSAPGMAAGMGAGAAITKGLQLFANPVGRSALVAAVEAGAAPGAGLAATATAASAAKTLKWMDGIIGGVGFGAGEGGVSLMLAGNTVESLVEAKSHEELLKSARYRELLESMDGIGSPEEAQAYAKKTLASEASSTAGWQSGLTVGVLGAGMGAFYGRLLGRSGGAAAGTSIIDRLQSTRAGVIGTSALGESITEGAQSGAEQFIQNKAMRDYVDPDQALGENVGTAMLEGAVLGGVMGGGFGALAGPNKKDDPNAIPGADIRSEQRLAYLLNQAKEQGLNAEADSILASDRAPLGKLAGLSYLVQNGRLREEDLPAESGPSGSQNALVTAPDGLPYDAEQSPDGLVGMPAGTQGGNSPEVNARQVMKTDVLAALHDSEILNSVVESVPIDVMNSLIGEEVTADALLSNPSVLLDRLAVSFDDPVLSAPVARLIDAIATSHPNALTGLATKEQAALGVGQSVGANSEAGAASGAANSGSHNDDATNQPGIDATPPVEVADDMPPPLGLPDAAKIARAEKQIVALQGLRDVAGPLDVRLAEMPVPLAVAAKVRKAFNELRTNGVDAVAATEGAIEQVMADLRSTTGAKAPPSQFDPEARDAEKFSKAADEVSAALGLSPEQAAVVRTKLRTPLKRDRVTGLYKSEELDVTVRAVQEAEQDGVYVEADMANLSGANAKLGNRMADELLREMAQTMQAELEIAGSTVGIRKGGDEFGFIVTGARRETVERAMARARKKFLASMAAKGHSNVPHTKGGKPGIGLHYATGLIEQGRDVSEMLSDTDFVVEKRKKGEVGYGYGSEAEAARSKPSVAGGTAGSDGQGAQGADRADGGRRGEVAGGKPGEGGRARSAASLAALGLPARVSDARKYDPNYDDLLALIAKRGGLSRDSAVSEGMDLADIKAVNKRFVGRQPFRRNGGKSIDELVEHLNEMRFRGDQLSHNDVLDMVQAALKGERVLSDQARSVQAQLDGIERDEQEAGRRQGLRKPVTLEDLEAMDDPDMLPEEEELELSRQEALQARREDSGARFSLKASAPVENLVAIHNLTAENLAHADSIGGLPVPSIGITKAETGYTKFGNITLIGSSALADPAQNPVWTADAYAQTFPGVQWAAVPYKQAMDWLDQFGDIRGRNTNELEDALIRKPNRDTAIYEAQKSIRIMRKWMRDNGVREVKDVYYELKPRYEWSSQKAWVNAVAAMKKRGVELGRISANSTEGLELYAAAKRSVQDYAKSLEGRGLSDALKQRLVGLADKDFNESNGTLNEIVLDRAVEYADKVLSRKREVNLYETREALKKGMGKRFAEFSQWVAGEINSLFSPPKIKVKGRMVPVTLDNLVEAMVGSRIVGTEETMTFNAGKVKAMQSNQLDSMQELKSQSDRLAGNSVVEEQVKEVDKLLESYRDAASGYHSGGTWAGMDASMAALAAVRGPVTAAKVRAAMASNGLRGVPMSVAEQGADALLAVRETAVEYFEAKPQRAVRLSEFAGALIPKKTSAETKAILDKHGIPFREYAEGQLGAELDRFSKTLQKKRGDVRFSLGNEDVPVPPAPARKGTSVEAIKGLTDLLQWKGLQDLVVAQTEGDLPDGARAMIPADYAGRVEGFYWNGSVYVVASNLETPADVYRVLVEETLGHGGLRRLFGETARDGEADRVLDRKLDEVYAFAVKGHEAEIREIASSYGLNLMSPAGRRVAAEEFLAKMDPKAPGFFRSIYDWMRDTLKAMGFKVKLSDTDLHRMMKRAHDAARAGLAPGFGAAWDGVSPRMPVDGRFSIGPEDAPPSPPQDAIERIFDESRWLDRGLKISKGAKLYRGEDKNTGSRSANEGVGLYTTTDIDQAKGYGTVREMGRESLPSNPIRFRDVMTFNEWRRFVARELGFRRESDFEAAYGADADVWIRSLDPSIDGVQIGTGHGAFFVKWRPRMPVDGRFALAGVRAKTANIDPLQKAKAMIAAGESPESARKQTGWFQGRDGKWRFEIDDSGASLKRAMKSLGQKAEPKRIRSVTYRKNDDGTYDIDMVPPNPLEPSDIVSMYGVTESVANALIPARIMEDIRANKGEEDYIGYFEEAKQIVADFEFAGFNALPLSDVLDHVDLFDAYPSLRNIMVMVDPKLGIGGALITMEDGQQVIRTGEGRQLSVLLHEIQHGIQDVEGFAKGGTIDSAAQDVAQARYELAEIERKLINAQDAASDKASQYIRDARNNPEIAKFVDDAVAKWTNKLGERSESNPFGVDKTQAVQFEITESEGYVGRLAKRADEIRRIAKGEAVDAYRNLAGETEARNVQARQRMTAAQRWETSPLETQDVPDDQQIVRFSIKRAKGSAQVEQYLRETLVQPSEDMSLGDRVRAWLARLAGNSTSRMKDSLIQGFLDEGHSIKALEIAKTGAVQDASVSAHKMYGFTKNISSVMSAIMKAGIPKYINGVFRPVPGRMGLIDIFRPLFVHKDGSLLHLWEGYAAAVRANRLIKETNPDGTSREKLFTQEKIDAFLALEHQYPEFKTVHQNWQKFNNDLLDLAVELGVIDAAARAAWAQNDYVPFYRAMEDVEGVRGPGTKAGISGQQSGIKRLFGGTDLIGNVFENMLGNTTHMIAKIYNNVAMQRVVDLAAGAELKKVPMAMRPVKLSNEDLARALVKSGLLVGSDSTRAAGAVNREIHWGQSQAAVDAALSGTGVPSWAIRAVEKMTPAQIAGWSNIFLPSAPMGKNIVSVMVGGKAEYYEVSDPLLLRTLNAMSPAQFGVLMSVMTGAKNFLTKMVTADPGFMAANFMRDTLSAWATSKAPIMPLVDSIRGATQAYKDDPLKLALMMAGAGMGGYYGSDKTAVRLDLQKELANGSGGITLNPFKALGRFWRGYQRIGEAGEAGSRMAIARSVLAKGGTEAEAAYQAMDIMNFSMRGDFAAMQTLTSIVPFMNARVQGLYKLARAGASENPAGFFLKGAVIMAAGLVLWAMNADDDRYNELQEWDKDTYWHFWVGDQHYKLPKPFEVGAIFGTIPERIAQYAVGNDTGKIAWQSFTRMLHDTFAMSPVPQLFGPILEQYANKNRFTGDPIVNQSLQGMLPEQQFTPWTSETARVLADMAPGVAPEWMRSPVRLEALFRGYAGTMGMYALQASNVMTRGVLDLPDPAASRPEDWPVVRRFYAGEVNKRTKYEQQLYDALDKANDTFRSIGMLTRYQRLEEAQELRANNPKLLQYRSMLTKVSTRMRDMNTRSRLIMSNPTMTPEQKRDMLDQITQQRSELLRQARPIIESAMAG